MSQTHICALLETLVAVSKNHKNQLGISEIQLLEVLDFVIYLERGDYHVELPTITH